MSAPRTLVTGGSGYFGEVLVSKLLERGEAVRNFDINPPAASDHRVSVSLGDIRDFNAVREACRGVEVVYHAVAQQPVAKDRELFWSVNHLGTKNILEACAAEGVRKLVVVSSTAVYGAPKSNPVNEKTTPVPGEDYGRAKLQAEQLCTEFAARGLDATIIRPRTILSAGRLGIAQLLFEWIWRGRNVPVLGTGTNLFQFVHASDLADACILAAARPGSTIYNCGAARFGTMRDALEAVCRHAGTGSRVRAIPSEPAIALMRLTSALGISPLGDYHALAFGSSMYVDISKARSELNWNPRYSNEEMMVESFDWYVRNRDSILGDRSPRSLHRSPVREGVLALVSRLF